MSLQKLTGWIPPTPEETENVNNLLLQSQGSPLFGDVASGLYGSGAGKFAMPFRAVEHFAPGCFDTEAQEAPDCTSHGGRNAGDISRSNEILIAGQPEEWVARGSTEFIYGFRGSYSQKGMSVSVAARVLNQIGYLVRLQYPFADLRKYSGRTANELARASKSSLDALKAEAGKHKFRYVARITSVEQARDALANGYGVFCGSMYGSDGKRDSAGRWRRNGSWNHCMAWGAVDDGVVYKDDLNFLIINSWGPWASGPFGERGTIPRGAGWVPSKDAAWIIKSGDCWAIGDFDGFKARDLPDYGSSSFLG